MESILKADIFFVISTMLSIIIGLIIIIILLYIWRIIRNVKKVSDDMKKTIHGFSSDADAVRMKVKNDGLPLGKIFSFFNSKKKKPRKKK